MKHLRILAFAAAAMLAGSTLASAQEAYTTSDVNMRAGPGSRYPVVTTIPDDRQVYIHGCLSNWDWCDVSWRRNRGWVFSDYLEALYNRRRIGFDEYRGYVDIPFVSFSFGYWDRYYRDRPWFDDWDHWGDRNDRRWRHRDRGDDNWRGRDGDRDDDRRGDTDRNRREDRDRYTNSRNDGDDDRDSPRERSDQRDEDNQNARPGMRCGTADADPSCPPSSRGRRMQMEQQ
jgi:uncharacterized protein YraI